MQVDRIILLNLEIIKWFFLEKAVAPLPAPKETLKEKKQSAKEKPSDSTTVVKKEIVSKVQTSPSTAATATSTVGKNKAASKEKSAPPTTPVKKSLQKEETTAKKTPRGRNTRSKK